MKINGDTQNVISFAGFELDTVRRQLRRGGKTVPINAKTFDLLIFLVERNGETLSKDEILEAVWNGQFVEEANLSVQVSALRKVFAETKTAPRLLLTIPGVGYKFVADIENTDEEITIEKHHFERVVVNDAIEETGSPKAKQLTVGKKTTGKAIVAFAGLVLLLVLGFAGYRYLNPTAKTQIQSIAVLPFKPLVVENRNESLEMGMADTLIAKLSNLREINVRPISAVRKYADLEQDAVAAGREQQVDAVLDGQIQQSGEKIRMTVRLINAADGTLIWTNQFDEKMSDIFVVQDSISQRVADALALKLTREQKDQIAKHHTENAEAYQLYLLGRFHFAKRTREAVGKSIEYFNQAIEIDPDYAAAHAGLADAHSTSGWFEFLPPDEAYPKAREAADKALQLDDTHAEAYAVLGDIERGYDWDLTAAERAYKRSLELDNNIPMTYHSYGLSLAFMGRQEESIAALRRARELDPLSVAINKTLGDTLLFARRYDDAVEQYHKVLEIETNNPYTYISLGLCYLKKNMPEQAIAEFLKASSVSGKATEDLKELEAAYKRSGMKGFWQEVIKQNKKKDGYISSYNIAALYAAAGENEQALEWLDKAYRERSSGMTALKVDPIFENLYSEPRFIELTRRVGLRIDLQIYPKILFKNHSSPGFLSG